MLPVISKTRVVICTEDRNPLVSFSIMESKASIVREQLEKAFGIIGRSIDEYIIVKEARKIRSFFVSRLDSSSGQRTSFDGYIIFLSSSMIDCARQTVDMLTNSGKIVECIVLSSSHRPASEIKTCFRGETVAFRKREGEGTLVALNHYGKADILFVGNDAETKEE